MAAKRALAGIDKGMLGFGAGNVFNALSTGVSYAAAPHGAQTYSANALVR